MDYSRLGQRIRENRKKSQMTQEELAEAIELSPVYIGQVERGERKLSLDTLIKIANCLHMSVESLLQDSLKYNTEGAVNELLALLKDRSREEISLIAETSRTILSRIKDNTVK